MDDKLNARVQAIAATQREKLDAMTDTLKAVRGKVWCEAASNVSDVHSGISMLVRLMDEKTRAEAESMLKPMMNALVCLGFAAGAVFEDKDRDAFIRDVKAFIDTSVVEIDV